MKTNSHFVFFLFVLVTAVSCKSNKQAQTSALKLQGDNSMNSVDWQGVYYGILPCADCEGIKTRIVLNNDLSYNMETLYLGKDEKLFQNKGTFKWNESGSKITLDDNEKQMYLVGENQLFHLDKGGNKKTGDLTNKYIMEKEKIELTGKYWKLIRLNGKPVDVATREPFIRFTTKDNQVNGNSSCNTFNGKYELLEGNRIKFLPFALTKMACVGNNIEAEFMQTFEKTTSYSLTANELLLQDEFETTLAKFEADFFK